MAALRCLSLALLLHQAACAGTDVTRAVGQSVTFRLQSLDGEAAAWSFRNEVIVIVKFTDPPEPIFINNSYKPRLTVSKDGSALTLSQLTMADAGTYVAQTSVGKTTFTLRVYRELAVPTVTCVVQNCSASSCLYTLRCAAAGSSNVSYSWSVGDQLQDEGPTLLVEELSLDKLPLTCTAENPVSRRNTTVASLAGLCAGTYSSMQPGIVAAWVIGAAVLLLLLTVILIYCKCKDWKTFPFPANEAMNIETGAEYATVYAQVSPSQQGDVPAPGLA
ncbi:SLAM family member 5-like [Phoenicopterus ruber ruber]